MFDAMTQTFVTLISEGRAYLFLLPIYTVLLAGERIACAMADRGAYDDRDAAANISITAFYFGINLVVGHIVPLAAMALIFSELSLFTLDQSVWGWLAAFILYDLAWYTDHRVAHSVGFFWAMHHIHHSSESYNMTVASRGFVGDITLLSRPTFFLLPVLGVSPTHFMVILIVTNILGIAQHTRLVGRLGPLDLVFATPSAHRVHHGSDAKYLDKNYGEILLVWDHLFGSYQREEEEPTYGVVKQIGTSNPILIELAGFKWLAEKIRGAEGWRDKLRCLYKPPNWEPAGQQPPAAAVTAPRV